MNLPLDMMKARFEEAKRLGIQPKISAEMGLELISLASQSRAVDALQTAIARLEDMLKGDDGQAWKEAEKALPGLRAVLNAQLGAAPARKAECICHVHPHVDCPIHGFD